MKLPDGTAIAPGWEQCYAACKSEVFEASCDEREAGDEKIIVHLIEELSRSQQENAAANLRVEQNESKFNGHLQHVSRFLTEMYQTMIDPLDEPEPSIKVAELCEMLLNQAREDREKLNRSPFNYPADWNTDSSLETWFPLTAEEMANLDAENAALTTRLEGLIRDNRASAAEVVVLRQENARLKAMGTKFPPDFARSERSSQ